MDRIYVPQWNKAPVHQLGLDLWRDVIVRWDPVVQHNIPERLLMTLLSMIAAERGGEKIDRALMKSMSTMLIDLGVAVYEEDFETPFLAATTEFYQAEAQANIASCDCPEYLRRAEQRLTQEVDRVQAYLDARTEPKLTKVVETELLLKQMHALVEMDNSGLVPLLEADRYEDLSRMYHLLKRVKGGLELVRMVRFGVQGWMHNGVEFMFILILFRACTTMSRTLGEPWCGTQSKQKSPLGLCSACWMKRQNTMPLLPMRLPMTAPFRMHSTRCVLGGCFGCS